MELPLSSDTIMPMFILWSRIKWLLVKLDDEFEVAPLPWVKLQLNKALMVIHSNRLGYTRSISEWLSLREVGTACLS